MTKAKTTKRALLLSVLSMMLCMAMLVGSTFAWFTDTVTSGMNKIVAGNLDVELEYATFSKIVNDEGETETVTAWKSVEGAEDLFGDITLWEPGTTDVVYFRLSNLGTLALKYRLAMNFTDTVIGKNADGGDIKLSEILEFGIVKDQKEPFASRADALAAVTNAQKVSEGYSPAEMSMGVTDEKNYFALVVYMPTTTGNEANYRGTAIPQIDLGVTLFATQDTVEKDSFGKDYDANAEYPVGSAAREQALIESGYVAVKTESDFAKAIENGEKVVLASGVTVAAPISVGDGGTAVVDLNGQKLTATGASAFDVKEGGKAELSNGTVEGAKRGVVSNGGNVKLTNMNVTAKTSYAIASYNGGSVEMTNCEAKVEGKNDAIYVADASSVKLSDVKTTSYYAGVYSKGENNKIEITDCDILSTNEHGIYHNGSYAPGTFIIKNTTIKGNGGCGIYISNSVSNDLMTLIVDNCNITGGYTSAVEVKHTNATITNSILTSTYSSQGVRENSSGTSTWGYAFSSAVNASEKGEGRGTVILEGNTYNIAARRATIYGESAVVTPIYTEPGVICEGSDFQKTGDGSLS